MKTMVGSAESPGDTSRDAGALDDPKLGQLVQFQMAESFPWANHCDICAQPLHAWDVISKPFYSFFRRLALELPCLSLLELGRPLAWCGGTSRSISSVEVGGGILTHCWAVLCDRSMPRSDPSVWVLWRSLVLHQTESLINA